MWHDYEAGYKAALRDESFLSWREAGARQKAMNIMRVCRGIEVTSTLEIGCGTGAVLRVLHSNDFAKTYACIDISFSAIQFTRQSCHNFSPLAFVGAATSLPFRDAAFSVAILTHVVEHLDDPVSALREASRVARFVVVEVPTEKVFSNFVRTNLLRHPYVSIAGAGHVQFWSPKSIREFLEKVCQLEILAHHRDLISADAESYGKERLGLAKPIIKEALKTFLPCTIYSWLLTTHATFLCRKPESGKKVQNAVGVTQGLST